MNYNDRIKTFYAFQTNYVIGIFTDLSAALECIDNREYTLRHFPNYNSAMRYMKITLSQEEQIVFGIVGKNMAFDKPYYRQRKKAAFDETLTSIKNADSETPQK